MTENQKLRALLAEARDVIGHLESCRSCGDGPICSDLAGPIDRIDAALAEPVGDLHETWDSAKTAALNDLQDVQNALLEVSAPDASSPADQIRKLYEVIRSDVVGLGARYYEARAEVEWLRKGLEPIADGTVWNSRESARFLLGRNK